MEKKKKIYLYIDHESKFIKFWDIFNLILIIFSVTVTPFIIIDDSINSKKFNIFENIIDIVFIFDFIKNFFLTFLDKENKKVIEFKRIFFHYLLTWFLLDLFTTIPYSIISYWYIYDNSDLEYFYILNLFKIVRIFKFLKNIKVFINFLFLGFKVKPLYERIITCFFIIIILFHNISCLWILIGKIGSKEKNWIYQNNIYYDKISTIYWFSFYWTIQTVFTVGYGDIGVHSLLERFIAILTMFFGVFIYSFLVGSISSIINNLDKDKEVLYKNKKVLQAIIGKYQLSKVFIKKLERFINNNYLIEEDEEIFLKDLNYKLKKDLYYEINSYKLQGIDYFKNKSIEFVIYLSPHLKLIQFNKNDYIYKEKEISNELYFIKSGKITLYKNYKSSKKIKITNIEKGNYFGEIELLSGLKNRLFFAKAAKDTKILAIQYDKLQEIFFKYFLKEGEEFIKKGIERKFSYFRIFEKKKINYKFNKNKTIIKSNIKNINSIFTNNQCYKFLIDRLYYCKSKFKAIKNIEYLHFIFSIEMIIYNIESLIEGFIKNKLKLKNRINKPKEISLIKNIKKGIKINSEYQMNKIGRIGKNNNNFSKFSLNGNF